MKESKAKFSQIYPSLNEMLRAKGEIVNSRNGTTRELLNVATEVDPLYSCVGGYGRNINIFFLLAEALWIWAGRKDVGFLNFFNSNMKNFSDNGKTFHAPYGWRLRNWGIDSDIVREDDEALHGDCSGQDQIKLLISNLISDPYTRQAVMSIWNPDLDSPLIKTKDKPCNDLLMYKIRSGNMFCTIANRSNDLHWGLPTNVFQFSFIGKIIAEIVGVNYVSQQHNSQSLHYYLDNAISDTMHENVFACSCKQDLYDFSIPFKFNFDFVSDSEDRLYQVDFFVSSLISLLQNDINTGYSNASLDEDLKAFSTFLYNVKQLLSLYIYYKRDIKERIFECFDFCLDRITTGEKPLDIDLLAFNFFFVRLEKAMGLREVAKRMVKYGKNFDTNAVSSITKFYSSGYVF